MAGRYRETSIVDPVKGTNFKPRFYALGWQSRRELRASAGIAAYRACARGLKPKSRDRRCGAY